MFVQRNKMFYPSLVVLIKWNFVLEPHNKMWKEWHKWFMKWACCGYEK